MAKTVYLANPYGFSAQQRTQLLPAFIRTLESLGAEVWEPFARNNQVDHTVAGWAYQIGQRDVADQWCRGKRQEVAQAWVEDVLPRQRRELRSVEAQLDPDAGALGSCAAAQDVEDASDLATEDGLP